MLMTWAQVGAVRAAGSRQEFRRFRDVIGRTRLLRCGVWGKISLGWWIRFEFGNFIQFFYILYVIPCWSPNIILLFAVTLIFFTPSSPHTLFLFFYLVGIPTVSFFFVLFVLPVECLEIYISQMALSQCLKGERIWKPNFLALDWNNTSCWDCEAYLIFQSSPADWANAK